MLLVKGLIFYKASFKNKIVKQNVHQAGTYKENSKRHIVSCDVTGWGLWNSGLF